MAQRPVSEALGEEKPKFAELNNLISEKVGGAVVFATDDWFALADNLVKESEAEWREGEFTEFGKWMDGWETRRKRKPGHDWCIIRLGVAGVVAGIDVDTSYFTGNYVPQVSLQGVVLTPKEEALIPKRQSVMGNEASDHDLCQVAKLRSEEWDTIIPRSKARPGYRDTCHTYLRSTSTHRYTHLRLNVYPDGGIARLRVFGYAVPDWSLVSSDQLVDLAAVGMGGVCVGYSDAHYGHPRNLISPGRGSTMADGWETARRLDRPLILKADSQGILQFNGFEWTVIRLGHPGKILQIEVDTHHFKGNFPDSCKIEGCLLLDEQNPEGSMWSTILPPQKLKAHSRHFYEAEVLKVGPVSYIRIVIVPDGGLSRVRLFGSIITPAASK